MDPGECIQQTFAAMPATPMATSLPREKNKIRWIRT